MIPHPIDINKHTLLANLGLGAILPSEVPRQTYFAERAAESRQALLNATDEELRALIVNNMKGRSTFLVEGNNGPYTLSNEYRPSLARFDDILGGAPPPRRVARTMDFAAAYGATMVTPRDTGEVVDRQAYVRDDQRGITPPPGAEIPSTAPREPQYHTLPSILELLASNLDAPRTLVDGGATRNVELVITRADVADPGIIRSLSNGGGLHIRNAIRVLSSADTMVVSLRLAEMIITVEGREHRVLGPVHTADHPGMLVKIVSGDRTAHIMEVVLNENHGLQSLSVDMQKNAYNVVVTYTPQDGYARLNYSTLFLSAPLGLSLRSTSFSEQTMEWKLFPGENLAESVGTRYTRNDGDRDYVMTSTWEDLTMKLRITCNTLGPLSRARNYYRVMDMEIDTTYPSREGDLPEVDEDGIHRMTPVQVGVSYSMKKFKDADRNEPIPFLSARGTGEGRVYRSMSYCDEARITECEHGEYRYARETNDLGFYDARVTGDSQQVMLLARSTVEPGVGIVSSGFGFVHAIVRCAMLSMQIEGPYGDELRNSPLNQLWAMENAVETHQKFPVTMMRDLFTNGNGAARTSNIEMVMVCPKDRVRTKKNREKALAGMTYDLAMEAAEESILSENIGNHVFAYSSLGLTVFNLRSYQNARRSGNRAMWANSYGNGIPGYVGTSDISFERDDLGFIMFLHKAPETPEQLAHILAEEAADAAEDEDAPPTTTVYANRHHNRPTALIDYESWLVSIARENRTQASLVASASSVIQYDF